MSLPSVSMAPSVSPITLSSGNSVPQQSCPAAAARISVATSYLVRQVAGGGMQPISLPWCLSGIISYTILFDVCASVRVCVCVPVSDGETGSRRENACTCITASSCGDPSDMDTLSRGDPISLYLAASKTQNFGKHILEILAYRCAAHRISCWIKVSKV